MKITTRDGRVFQGTPIQIVKAMQDIAFGVDDLSLDRYIDWVVDNARRFEGVALNATGETTEARATTLIADMLARNLVADLPSSGNSEA
jgi:hypothetical protein